jgi:hypothetical protein
VRYSCIMVRFLSVCCGISTVVICGSVSSVSSSRVNSGCVDSCRISVSRKSAGSIAVCMVVV